MTEELECPRCQQPASGTARKRGHCTSCGAALVSSRALKEAAVRSFLYGRTTLAPKSPERSRR